MSGYQLSELAKADLLGIFLYTLEAWGEEQLPIYLDLVEAAMERIATNPYALGSKTREDLASGCRTFRSGKHVVVYRKKGDTLEIARILHQSMDFSQHVGEETFPELPPLS